MNSSDYLKLFRLVRNDDVNGLQTFLSTSDLVDLNYENKRTHLTPLMVACNRPSSNLPMVKLLIEKGAEVDYQTDDHGYSALMKAVENGNVEAVKCLIKHGAQVDLEDNRGNSALEFGCEKGNVEVVKVLLEVEGVESLSSGDMQHSVHSSFNTAVEHNRTKLVRWFLESCTVINIPVSALFFAIDNQSIEMVQLLLDHGAEVNIQNERKVSALMLAASKGNIEVAKKLLERGADVSLKGEEESTALLSVLSADDHAVPQQSKIDIVKLLLEYGDIRGDDSFSPLRHAIESRSAELVKLFIDNIKDLVYQINKGAYLHLMEDVYSSPDVLKLLLDAGADPNITFASDTPLLSVDDHDIDAAKMLIDYGANVNQRNGSGVSPILRAVEKSMYKLAELLLEKGADISLSDRNGESARASLRKHPRQILRSLDSISSVQSEVQEYPKLRSLLKTFMDDQGSVPHNPYDIHVRDNSDSNHQQLSEASVEASNSTGSTDSLGAFPQSDNASDTDEEHLNYDGQDNSVEETEFITLKPSIRSLEVTSSSLLQKIEKTLQSTTAESIYLKNEKKFSIIAYGVSECPEGTSKPDQSSHDFGEVASFLLKVDSSIQPQSIKDMHRLGKYHHERPRPRPILVKFLRSADVFKVLAKRSLIQPPYSVKPYLSKEEQRCESALLKERWSLIQSGTSCESIKIRLKDGWIMVDSKLYGKWDSTTNTLIKQ